MSRKQYILIAMPVLALVIFFSLTMHRTHRSDVAAGGLGEVTDPAAIEVELVRQLEQLEPGSPAYKKVSTAIKKMRVKAAKTVKGTENSEPFLEALAQIKTAPNGETYKKNYRAEALQRANIKTFDLNKTQFSNTSFQALDWKERGPGNVSGRAQAIVIDKSDASGNTWFVATIGGGIWKTSDAGVSWQHKSPELSIYSTGAIAQSESNPDVFYVGTGMGYGRVVDLVGNGVWKSTDHGETWSQLASTANGELLEAVNRIVVDPNDENVVVLCSNDSFAHLFIKGGVRKSGIFRTTDGGQSWTQVYDSDLALGTVTDNRVQQIIANPLNFNTLYASVNEVGVIKSTDAGLSWQISANNFALPLDVGNPTSNGFGLAGISVRSELAMAPSDTARVYAAVERPRGIADLFMTKDAGANWILVNDTGNDPNWFNSFSASGATGAYTAGWFDNTIAVHPFDENVVFVGGVNIFRLTVDDVNDVRTSQLAAFWLGGFGVPSVHADHHDLKMIPDESNGTFRIVNANDGGLSISNDGGTNWSRITGQNTTQFYAADKKPGEDVYIGGAQDNSTWHSGANPGPNSQWSFDFGGDGAEVAWNASDPNLVLGSSQGGGYNRSTDAGATWTAIPAAKAGFSPFISKLGYSHADPDQVFTVGFNGVGRSDDFGASWEINPITGNWLGYRPFDNVEVSNADPRVVWISSRLDIDPPIGRRGGIHISRDGGLNFTEISANFPANVIEASGIATHPSDPGTAYFLFSAPGRPKILKTTDFGQTFVDISGFGGSASSTRGFPDVATFSLVVMPFDTNILWAGTEIGLFISDDGGASWALTDSGFPTVSVFEMKLRENQIVVATYGRGIWSVELPELANYSPPVVTLAPRLRPLEQDFSLGGAIFVKLDLRSSYDSTKVFLDGNLFANIGVNDAPLDTLFSFVPTQSAPISMSAMSFKNGDVYKSSQRTFQAISLSQPVASLAVDFNSGQFIDFVSNGFAITTAVGFQDAALHSPHPYPNGAEQIFTITAPIIMSTGTISFDEVVIVEPGIAGVPNHTNPNFFDFCVVEGSSDGISWVALAPGYDSRDDASWLATFSAGGPGTPALFRPRNITIQQGLFEQGSNIFIRFRLFGDAGLAGWGWAIDNLEIQSDVTSVASDDLTPQTFSLAQNYPNPFNPTTTINYTLPAVSDVKLSIYNIRGQRVRTLIEKKDQQVGTHSIKWNGRDETGRSVSTGLYFYRLETAGLVLSRKMTFIK